MLDGVLQWRQRSSLAAFAKEETGFELCYRVLALAPRTISRVRRTCLIRTLVYC